MADRVGSEVYDLQEVVPGAGEQLGALLAQVQRGELLQGSDLRGNLEGDPGNRRTGGQEKASGFIQGLGVFQGNVGHIYSLKIRRPGGACGSGGGRAG